MTKRKKLVFLVIDLLLLIGLAAGIWFFQCRADREEEQLRTQEDLERRYSQTIHHDGREIPLRRSVTSLLLIGTDNFIHDSKQNEIEAFYNDNLADFLVVLVFDHANKTITPFQICRDTMCDVPWLSVNGLVGGTEYQQITLAHSYGTGGEDSCVNTRNAVSALLFGVPIERFFAFTMDAVPVLNDLVGGVTVTLEDDVPALGPEYVRGADVTLRGEAALRFVRYRDIELLDSNLTRMGHHRAYLQAFTGAARSALAENEDLAVDAFKAVEPFLCTDLSIEALSDIVDQIGSYEILPVVVTPGEYVMGEEFAEYIVDKAALWDGVYSTFCATE